jgi:hypothetical protein
MCSIAIFAVLLAELILIAPVEERGAVEEFCFSSLTARLRFSESMEF